MPIDPAQLQTGGALQGAVAASLLREHEAAAELQAGDTIGSFRVIRELGRGGMAVVYLAERNDGEYEQCIALKWMQAGQGDSTGEALFRRERQALANLNHPHIARLLDGGRTPQGRPWFAMEFIDGPPLDRYCIDAALPLRQRLERFLEVCSAVAFAHAHGVLHRDIKPENIIVAADGKVYFLDFGIARILDVPSLTKTEALMGPHTPGYAAPEQFNNLKSDIDSRADLFSIGVVTYECLSGKNPFSTGAISHLDILQRTETITPVSFQIIGDTQQQFMGLLSSLMGKYPSRRPKDATQALNWLSAAMSTLKYEEVK